MKKEFILLVIVGCQVFLLMNMVIADSYIIGQANPLMENLRGMNENNKIKNLINLGMNLLTGFLSLKQISFVSAEVGFECCLETNEGGICQDIISGSDSSTDANSCASPLQTGCDSVSECAKGCCVDSIEGLCTTQALQQECVNSDGIWNDEDSCLVQECQKGCCMIGNNAKFITEKRCEYLSSLQGLDKDFRDLETELECLALSSSQDEGACVLSGICNRKTKQECFAIGGEFYNNLFCSAAPGINCSAGEVIGCADEENLHDVYYFDSCGNRENIAKECDYPENTCDDKSCKYLGCENAVANVGTQDRANGERWCLYDGSIGDGKDTVGSEHWIAYCHNGEVEIDRCGEYRGSICTQSVIEEDGETFSQASCVINEAFSCIDYNSEQSTLKENCEANTDCMIKNINVDTGFKFDVCTPRYPHGFELTGGESLRKSLSTELCSLANQNCTVLYEKKLLGGWSCKSGGNCNCEKAEFTNQMNDFCVSLGDCGSYVNYIGEGTKNIKVSGAPEVSWTKYIKYSEPVKGQFAEPKSLREILGSMFGTNIVDPDNNETGMNKLVKKIGMISGASGTLVVGAGWLGNFIGGASGQPMYSLLNSKGGIWAWGSNVGSAFAGAAIGASIGVLLGSYIAKKYGISGTAATVIMIAGGVAGASIGMALIKGSFTTGNPYIIVVVAIIVIILVVLLGWGKTSQRTVEFTCMPWQAPVGGKDCEKCNEDTSRPCNKYQCSSLGQACIFLNENTENPTCESIAYETKPPVISVGEVFTEGYEFKNEGTKKVEIRKESGDCIREYEAILFSLKTDENSQCKYGFVRTANYNDMDADYPAEGNIFSTNHTFGFMMPSLGSLEVFGVTGDLTDMFGNMNMYVRCQDYHGNFNLDEYTVNFCINSEEDTTPAWVEKYVPEDKSYLSYGKNETRLKIYLNEPAECKYDIVKNKNYNDMANTMTCKTGLEEAELYGWACSTNLTGLTAENKIYIKCRDKPWIVTDEDIENYGDRNINQEDFVYTLYVSENKLKIDSIKVSYGNQEINSGGTIMNGFEPISLELEVRTSKGVDNGVAVCYWGNELRTPFFETYSVYHRQALTGRMEGDYSIDVKCEDVAGNVDYGEINFTINIDSEPPVIISNSSEGDNMILTTDEEAECYYHPEQCNFNFENGTSITTALSTEHIIYDLNPRITYHVKCADAWDNKNPDCAIIIRATEDNDGGAPIVVRTYYSNGKLRLITNEDAKCYYALDGCDFSLLDGALMTDSYNGYSTQHSTEWNSGWTYYVKCEDSWGNKNNECAIIVEAGN